MQTHIKATVVILLLSTVMAYAQNDSENSIIFTPIKHGTFVINASDITIYIDPVGDTENFKNISPPDIILITDIHGDHLSPESVKSVQQKETVIIGPKAVIDKLGYGEILNNGDIKTLKNVSIEAVPMYNLTEERSKYHEKGRGNGYVVTLNKKRIYISGDTEDIEEMRELKEIDYAFVCMNLPYTMTVEQAASAVLEFKPKVVFPFHYRGTEGFSDIEKFKKLVSKDKDIEARFLNWYPE